DFEKSLQEVRPSVPLDELGLYEDWNNKFGTISTSKTYDSGQQFSGSIDLDDHSDNHHTKKMKTIALGAYGTSSEAQTCINLDDDDDDDVYDIIPPAGQNTAKRAARD
ncbi:fidgetin-like protein 1, partial [Tanacetum coccineum]